MKKAPRGIALLQVLLITALLSVFALYLLKQSQNELKTAKLAQDNAAALLTLKSAESDLLFSLLTREKQRLPESQHPIVRSWNFHNQPFWISDDLFVNIQDHAGLVGIRAVSAAWLRKLFAAVGLPTESAIVVEQSLLDWQDTDKLARLSGAEAADYRRGPRNGNILLLEELAFVRGVTNETFDVLSRSLTPYAKRHFNPMTAPLEVLAAEIGWERAQEVVSVRNQSSLQRQDFESLTGINETLDQVFAPGNILQIKLTSTFGDVRLTKQLIINADPYAVAPTVPLEYLEVRWN